MARALAVAHVPIAILGGLGLIPIGLGAVLGCFSILTLVVARPLQPSAGSV